MSKTSLASLIISKVFFQGKCGETEFQNLFIEIAIIPKNPTCFSFIFLLRAPSSLFPETKSCLSGQVTDYRIPRFLKSQVEDIQYGGNTLKDKMLEYRLMNITKVHCGPGLTATDEVLLWQLVSDHFRKECSGACKCPTPGVLQCQEQSS